MTLAPLPGSFRPGAPITPRPIDVGRAAQIAALKFLTAEERATATLMGFFEDARLEIETFIRTGDLSVSDATFYRQLLDETLRIGTELDKLSATWVTSVIPEGYSAGWRTWSNTVVPKGALEALSRETLSLIRGASEGIRTAIRQTIALGILEGLSGADLRQRIIATGLSNIPHWPSVDYRAGVIARTETMKAYNAGALDGIVANGARFVRWLASPDEATCPICLPRDHVVYRIGAAPEDFTGDPYPAAQPLPHIPAHPRCRCTIRAEYRDADGKVIRATAPETEPMLPADAMGGQDEPTLPPAAGDFAKAVGNLPTRDELDEMIFRATSDVTNPGTGLPDPIRAALQEEMKAKYEALRSFWRNLGQLDDEMISILTSGTKSKVEAKLDAFLRLRYDVRYVDKAGMTPKMRQSTIKALELIRSQWPSHVVENPYLRLIGEKPYGARKFGPNQLARAFQTGHVEWNTSLAKKYENTFLRMIDDGSFEVIVHEFMHTTGYNLGLLHLGRGEFARAWSSVRGGTGGVSPTPGALKRLDSQVVLFQHSIDRDTIDGVYKGSIRNLVTLRSLKAEREKLAKLLADGPAPGQEYWPTEYAKTNDHEDFAESATMYLLDPPRLKKWSPRRYEFLKNRVFGGKGG